METVFFGNEVKGLALTLSNVPGTGDHYLEWNDQSNACYNGVETIQLSGENLLVQLLPQATKQIGVAKFEVKFNCDSKVFDGVERCLMLIFKEKLLVKPALIKKKAAPKKDYSKIKYLNLEGKNLKKLPDYVVEMTALETVKLAYNPKLDLQDAFEVLAAFPNLVDVGFSIEGGAIPENFGKLTQLESVSVTELTKPCTFPESIGQLKQLKSLLVMSDADIVLPESFAELTELTDLNIRVRAWNLPSRFYQLLKLKQLDFSNCRFTHVPPEMAQMTEVETVVFNNPVGQDFSQIMPIIAQMPNLKVLELDVNPVPNEVGLCKNIEELIIWAGADKDNPLYLPDELFELTQLQTLTINRSYIDRIPDGIGRLKGLKTLALQECEFECLPDSIGELTSLEFLNLGENPSLKSLPDSVGNLVRLESLYIHDTPQLKELPLSLKNLTKLTDILISNREALKNVPEAWDSLLT